MTVPTLVLRVSTCLGLYLISVYDEPYLLALLPESIEVRTVDPHLLIQSLPVKARLACGSKQGLVYVASSEHVWCVQSQPVSLQIRVLLEQKQFQLAVKLTVSYFLSTRYQIMDEVLIKNISNTS